ncbi:MAG: hypothetical protein ABGZ17_01475, partial [Planctomycetaceae bacterium]
GGAGSDVMDGGLGDDKLTESGDFDFDLGDDELVTLRKYLLKLIVFMQRTCQKAKNGASVSEALTKGEQLDLDELSRQLPDIDAIDQSPRQALYTGRQSPSRCRSSLRGSGRGFLVRILAWNR